MTSKTYTKCISVTQDCQLAELMCFEQMNYRYIHLTMNVFGADKNQRVSRRILQM